MSDETTLDWFGKPPSLPLRTKQFIYGETWNAYKLLSKREQMRLNDQESAYFALSATNDLLDLQNRINETDQIVHEGLLQSSLYVNRCDECGEYYYRFGAFMIGEHKCPTLKIIAHDPDSAASAEVATALVADLQRGLNEACQILPFTEVEIGQANHRCSECGCSLPEGQKICGDCLAK